MSLNNANVKNKTLENLLNYQDERFIKYAYEIILGRFPDAEGLQFYLSKLKLNQVKLKFYTSYVIAKKVNPEKLIFQGLMKLLRDKK